MSPRTTRSAKTLSMTDALEGPWRKLEHIAGGDELVKAQSRDDYEDAGRTENRVRHDYTGRYPIELLQNGHDACEAAGTSGAVRFAVTDSALLVANDGEPFTPERVRSLVRLGSSDKSRGAGRRTIGYKGVGFTAVFEITDRPQIISRNVAFELDRARARREVGQALGLRPDDVPARGFPFLLAREVWEEDAAVIRRFRRSGAATVIRLPLRGPHTPEEVEETLRGSFPATSMLFMPFVGELELRGRAGTDRWSSSRGRKPIGTGKLVHIRRNGEPHSSWLLAEDSVRAHASDIGALEDPLWAGVRNLHVAVALPWRDGPRPAAGQQPLHVYFPTDDQLGRAVLVHGDFYVDSSRRHIETTGPGGEISRTVASTAARLVATLAESVTPRGDRLLQCLAVDGAVSGFGQAMGELLDENLARALIVRPADGSRPRRPTALKRLGLGSPRLERDLLPLLGRGQDLLRPGDGAGPASKLLDALGSPVLDSAHIARRVRGSGEARAVAQVLLRWLERLDERARRKVVSELRNRQVLLDVSGRWRTPRQVVIRTSASVELPARLRRTELAAVDPLVARLARILNVTELSLAAAVDEVLAAMNDERFGSTEMEARSIHDFTRRVWEADRRVLQSRHRRLGRLAVPARLARRTRASWQPATTVYFPEKWTGDRTLQALYGRFRRPEFLAVDPPADAATRRSLRAFYATLGVMDAPRVLRFEGNDDFRIWHRSLTHYDKWVALPEVAQAFVCSAGPGGHPGSARHVALSCVDRLDEILADGRREVLAALARFLATTSDPYGHDAEIRCMNKSHNGTGHHNRAVGYQRWRLESTAWVPVRNDPSEADLRPPGEAWTGTRLPPWLLVPQARLRPEQARTLGFVNIERPTVEAVERALGSLASSFDVLADASKDVRRTADWLLHRADRLLARADGQRAAPALPATRGTAAVWSTQALIQDMPGLGDFAAVDLLPPGPLHGLRRGYGLRPASEVVDRELELGRGVRAQRLLSQERKAELAALLARQGQPEETAASKLARLSETPVESIYLRFSLDGAVSNAEAVRREFFLDLRRDSRGRVIGARLLTTPGMSPVALIDLGRELAGYLDAADLHATVSLFLVHGRAMLASEHVGQADVDEARRRVGSHTRGAVDESDQDPTFDDLDDWSTEAGEEGDDTSGADGDSGPRDRPGSSEGALAPAQPAPPPPLDHTGIFVIDVEDATSSLPPAGGAGPRTPSRGGGGSGPEIDWARLERERRLYGYRGEEAAFHSERARLVSLGWDPDLVQWISSTDETSLYDICSLGDEGGPRYIEVKSTTGDDPSDPFPISAPQLRFALAHRRSYFIYRVTKVRDARPVIHRYYDPLAELELERGYLRTMKAVMGLPLPRRE